MSQLILNLLGTFDAVLDRRPVVGFRYDKVRALLAYLAVESDRPHRREKLVGLLWPGYPESSARRSLTQALYHLRTALGDREAEVPFLLVTPHTIQLNPVSNLQLDVQVLLAALESGKLTELEKAEAAYRGPFLAGLSLDDCPDFDEWVIVRREALQQRAVAALHHLARLYQSTHQPRAALRVAHHLVAIDPFWEVGQRTLMRLLAADGQYNAALAQYEELQRLLDAELGVAPELATRAVVDEIRQGREQGSLGRLLSRAAHDRQYRLRVVVIAALAILAVALPAIALTRVNRGPLPWNPSGEFEGVSLWPEIELQPLSTNPVIGPSDLGSQEELVLAPTVVDTGSRIDLFYTVASSSVTDPIVIGHSGSTDRVAFAPAAMNNPAISPDGSGFDAWAVAMPILRLEEGRYQLYYAGSAAGPLGPGLAIGRATTDAPELPWSREPEPILEPGRPGEWDSCAVVPGSVVVSDKERRLYYLGSSQEDCDRWMVGMAVSVDGVEWVKYDNPETGEAPFAESDPVLSPGDPGAWDGVNLAGVAVRDTGRGWEMFYTGEGEGGELAIGYAWSVEGIRWHRHPDNPVLAPEDDHYTTNALQVHDVTFDGTTYRLYYDYGSGNGLGVAEGTVKWPIVVNTTKDELNADGDCSLREAIEAANRDAPVDGCAAGQGADRVVVPGGRYRLALDGVDEDANRTGDLDVLDDLTLEGVGAEATILDGDGIDRIVHNHGARLGLLGLTLSNGRAPIEVSDGGGLLNSAGQVSLEHCVVSRNAARFGGGLANTATAGGTSIMTLTNTRVISNTAEAGGGGIAHFNYPGAVDSTMIMTVTGSTIAGNKVESALLPAWTGFGGGIFSVLHVRSEGSVSSLTLVDTTVTDNVAACKGDTMVGNGGGLFIVSGETRLISSTVSGNRALGEGTDSGAGGGLWVSAWTGPTSVMLIDSTVSGNSAASAGGGVAAFGLSCLCGDTPDPTGWCEALLPTSPPGPSLTHHNTVVTSNQAPVGADCLQCGGVWLPGCRKLED